MYRNTGTILGISVGTRFLGIAVIRSKTLIVWEVKTFKGTWSIEKHAKITKTVKDSIGQYAVTQIAIKIPHSSRSSAGVNALLKDIARISKTCGSIPVIYSLADIKTTIPQQEKWERSSLKEYTLMVYPELSRLDHPYYVKLFEAVCVAHLLSR